jgi:polyisoprenoid-binding protein YceI
MFYFINSLIQKEMKTVLIALTLLITGTMAEAQNTLQLNVEKSSIKWTGKKVLGKHYGTISFQSGSLIQSGESYTGGEFVVDMNSITCEDLTDAGTNAQLVGHLKSDDFFGVANHPTSKLVIKSGTSKGDNQYEFSGELTIKENTNPVKIEAVLVPEEGGVVFTGKLIVNRAKYNVRYGSGSFFQNLGDNMIYDEFELDFKVFFTK